MSKYEVKDIVCDYGLYEDGKLKLICNSKRNALLIKAIMDKDNILNGNQNGNYYFTDYDYNKFMDEFKK
jgi:hypothetical protein